MLILRGGYLIFLTFSLVLNWDIPPATPWGEKWWSSPVVVSPTLHVKGEVSEQSSTPYPTSVKFRCFCLKHFSIQPPQDNLQQKLGFTFSKLWKRRRGLGPLKSDSWGAKRVKTLLRLSIPKRFWVKTSNLQQAPKLWRISKSSILIYIYRFDISPPGKFSQTLLFPVFFPQSQVFQKRLETFQSHDVRNFGEIWWMRMKASESTRTRKKPWCFEHGTWCVNLKPLTRIQRITLFTKRTKKKTVFSTHFFWVCNKNGMFFLKFFKSSSVRAVSVVSSISLRLIDGLGPGSGWGNILLSRSSWRARCYNN